MQVAAVALTSATLGLGICFFGFQQLQQKRKKEKYRRHPYAATINTLVTVRPNAFISRTEAGNAPIVPPPHSPGCLTIVTTPNGLKQMATYLSTVQIIALDIEHHSQYNYYGRICLIQLSDGVHDFIVDTLCIPPSAITTHLKPILENKDMLKIVHGGRADIMWLQRDFEIYLVNIFDTEKAAQVTGHHRLAFASLLLQYCNIHTDKALQTADWSQRPLPPSMIEYGQVDVHYLIYIADILWMQLSTNEEARLTAIERSQAMTLSLWCPSTSDTAAATAAASLYKQASKSASLGFAADSADGQVLASLLVVLCKHRDGVARKINKGVQYVFPDRHLIQIATLFQALQTPLTQQDIELLDIEEDEEHHHHKVFVSNLGGLNKMLTQAAKHSQHNAMQLHVFTGGSLLNAQQQSMKRKMVMTKDEKNVVLGKRYGVKNPNVYENTRMFSQEGKLLCYTDKKRLQWYVRKGLATVIEDDAKNFSVRLTFQHNTSDQERGDDEFYTASRTNQCVGCGDNRHFLKYKILPSCYRKALPVELKSHRSHDVVLLCVSCHETAQSSAERLKRVIATEIGIPLFQPLPRDCDTIIKNEDRGDDSNEATVHIHTVRRFAVALQNDAGSMPLKRRRELEKYILRYLNPGEEDVCNSTDTDDNTIDPETRCTLTQKQLRLGLLAGLGYKQRRKTIKRWVAQGIPSLPDELTNELKNNTSSSGTKEVVLSNGEDDGGKGSCTELRGLVGYEWHGRKVVETIQSQDGTTGLSQLLTRFREEFVKAVNPKFLPPGWSTNHFVPRGFGEFSVFADVHDGNDDQGEEEG